MESGSIDVSLKGVSVPVSDTSDVFENSILATLRSAYLYEESPQSFRYKSAVLIENALLEEKYNAFRAKRRQEGYSEEDLKETYGFLLFDDANKARALGETGVLTGNSACTTLGDPLKGVYISMYSDCVDLNRWYHGKSGYIVIIRLTKGRVKRIFENYTQNFTPPTVGFDCHVSEKLPAVSAKTSSFLAFQRTQYYIYELLDDGSCETAKSPSAACPFAIVSFSYTDTKATIHAPHDISDETKLDLNYLAWRGQLQIGTQLIDVGLRSVAVASIPVKLPPVVKVERAISMLDLWQLLPRDAFETCFFGEVFLGGFYFTHCELVPSEAEKTKSFSLLLQKLKEKDLALPVPLNDGGFLILLYSSHFIMSDGSESKASEVMQAVFVFPGSRHIHRGVHGTKSGQRKGTLSSEILQVLPALNYAEREVEKMRCDSSGELCEVLLKHMQSYTALANPELELSTSREVSIFPDQYDILPADKHLYSSPEWTKKAWHCLRSYVSKPASFQLPLSTASEIVAVEQVEERYDLDDDVYICPSSPEEAHTTSVCIESEDQGTDQKSSANVETYTDSIYGSEDQLTSQKALNVETSVDSCIETHTDLTAGPQNVKSDDLQLQDAANDTENWTVFDMGAKVPLTPTTSDDLPAELIVSITSAEPSIADKSLNLIDTIPAVKPISCVSEAKLQTNCLHDENVNIKSKDSSEATDIMETKPRKLRRGHSKGLKKAPKAFFGTLTSQTVRKARKDSIFMRQKDDQAKGVISFSNTHWKKLRRQKWKFGKLSSTKKNTRCASVGLRVAEGRKSEFGHQCLEGSLLMENEMCPPRQKNEHWLLKPVVTECGRILVPHGLVDFDQIQSLKDWLQCKYEKDNTEKKKVDASVNAHEFEMEQVCNTEIAVETSCLNKQHILVTQSDNGSQHLNQVEGEHSSKNDAIDHLPSHEVKNKEMDALSPGKKTATQGAFLLSKLKSVLLKGKRKNCMTDGPKDSADNTEPCFKKGKGSFDAETVNVNDQDNVIVNGVSERLSVDPLFAYALGLTPVEKLTVQKRDGQNCDQRRVSSETQEQTVVSKQPQIVQGSPTVFQRRGKMKTLKKHQGISTECVKKTWWLHFPTPACLDTEKLKCKEHTKDISLMKTFNENINSTCSSADALNLLADLALSNDLVPPHSTFERNPESMKMCELKKDVASSEQESVLHALLRQPSARPIHLLEYSSSHLMGDKEMVDLISKEHNYSLPPSSPLALGLPGTPFQVSPLSGSTRLLHHYQPLYGETVPPFVCQEVRGENNHWTQKYLKKHLMCKKFKYSRSFVNKDKSVQVTRQWKENYDFHGDSKFTSDPKGKGVMRALHGPWDFSIQDNPEEIRLIVHMWIGLFYSRSTPRFFHIDSNFTNQFPEESGSLEMPTQMVSSPVKSELKLNAFPSIEDTQDNSASNALYLSKKDNVVLNEGSMVLDLSLRNSNEEAATSNPQLNHEKSSVFGEQKEAREKLNTLKPSLGQQDVSTLQYCSRDEAAELTDEAHDVRSHYEDDQTCIPSQKTESMEGTGMSSFKGLFILPQEKMTSVSNQTGNYSTATGIGHVLHACSKDKMCFKGDAELSQTTEILVETHPSRHGKENETRGGEEIEHTDENIEIQPKNGVNCQVKENICHGGKMEPSLKVNCTGVCATNKDSSCIDCNSFESKKFSREEPEAKPTQPENNNVDFCSVHEGKLIIDEDEFGKDGPDEKDICILAIEPSNDQNNQPLPMRCDSPDSVEKGYSTDGSCQTLIHEQPPKAEDCCHDLNLRISALTDEHVMSEKAPHTPCGTESVNKEAAVEESSEIDHLNDEEHHQEVAIPIADVSYSSLDQSCVTESFLQKKDSLETGSKNPGVQVNCGLSSDNHEVQGTKSVVIQGTDDNTSQEKSFQFSTSSQYEVIEKCQEASTKVSIKTDKTKLGMSSSEVVIPFSGTNAVHTTHSLGKIEDVFQSQKGIHFTSMCSDRIFPLDVSETNQQVIFGSESVKRCPTPTLDEKPLESIPCLGSDSSFAEIYENTSPRHQSMGSKLIEVEILAKQKLCQKSKFDYDPNPQYSHDPDLELRTQRVLQSIDVFLSTSNHINNSCQVEIFDIKSDLDQNPNLKPTPIGLNSNHISHHLKDKNIEYLKPAVVSTSNSQELHRKSSNDLITAPFKTKLEEVLGVKLQLDKIDSSLPQDSFDITDKLSGSSTRQGISHSCGFSTSKCLQAKKADVPDKCKTAQPASNHESFSYTQRPVVAVKPSTIDENQADCNLKDEYAGYPLVTYSIPTTMALERSEKFMGNSELSDTRQASNVSSPRNSQLSNINNITMNLEQALLDPSYHYQEKNTVSSSLAKQSFESAKNGHHNFLTGSLLGNDRKTRMDNSERKLNNCSKASTSFVATKDNSSIDDCLIKEPQTSLICTVFNTNQKSSYSFLEKVSKRCLQDDLTQGSIEQEHLIFSEKIKQLLKRKKRTTGQQDTHDHFNLSCSSPLTVQFSSLEKQEDSLDLINTPSIAGQKIKVDVSNKTDMAVSTKERKLSKNSSPEIGNLKENCDISGVTAICARSYEAMMDELCADKKAPYTPKHLRNNRTNKNFEPRKHFDFCDQIKQKMDESFQSNLNSIVKKSRKVKYRFYILETSDDHIFKETKAQMESEGHIAIQPSEFFHGENNSSSLLIILRNEDIAEHICKVPHLLELKRTPGVQFAGIDEPDDIVNLTHQELFTQGGFIMFDRAALEALSLCNMKKCSEILHELSKTGKWKWMVHYRDNRRLKENARLSSEAKEKQCFLNSCQDTGILEVLPYHECDATSRHQPNYLTCLVRLQVHNISAHYPVFITDTIRDGEFGRNGIFTLTVNSFLTISSRKTFL